MKLKESSDLYIDFLLCQTSQASSTMCSDMLDNAVKHDSFSRMLKVGDYASRYIWNKAKTILKDYKKARKILSIDNTIIHKPDSKVNEVVNWFYDHSEARVVKGANLISALIHIDNIDLPVGFEIQSKDQFAVEVDKKGNSKFKRKSRYTINEIARKIILKTIKNVTNFDYLVADRYFASKTNLKFLNTRLSSFL